MATSRNKEKIAVLNKGNCEEQPRSNLARNSIFPKSQENYITQVFKEIESRVTKKLYQEFGKTESFLGALSRLDDFLMNPLIKGHSGTTPKTSRNIYCTSQGANEDDSQTDLHPEAGTSQSQTTQNSGPEAAHDSNFFYFVFSLNKKLELTDVSPRA